MLRVAVILMAFAWSLPSHARRGLLRESRVDRADRRDARQKHQREAPGRAFDREEIREKKAECERAGKTCVCPIGASGPGSLPGGPACMVAFEGSVVPLEAGLRERMKGVTWHEGCPVPLTDLALVRVMHWDFSGQVREGAIVVRARVADDVRRVFERLYESRFPLESVRPAEDFGGDDDASMAANNTVGFNCRRRFKNGEFSRHAEGEAIDVNPRLNPYVRGERIRPPGSQAYLSRPVEPGVILPDGPVIRAFRDIGWHWGGRWRRSSDFQHFSRVGD